MDSRETINLHNSMFQCSVYALFIRIVLSLIAWYINRCVSYPSDEERKYNAEFYTQSYSYIGQMYASEVFAPLINPHSIEC